VKLYRRIMAKLEGMLVTLLAPELLLAIAISDRSSAAAHASTVTQRRLDGIEWSITHAFYANMGGFVIQFTDNCSRMQKTSLLNLAPANPILPAQNYNSNNEFSQLTDNNNNNNNMASMDASTAINGSNKQIASQSAIVNLSTAQNMRAGYQGPLDEPFRTSSLVSAAPAERSNNKTPRNGSYTKATARRGIRPLIQTLDSHLKRRPNGMTPSRFSDKIDRIFQDIRERIIKEGASSFNINLLKAHLNNLGRLEGGLWALDANQLVCAKEIGLVEIPNISKEEIEDQSKGDALVKILAISQALWQILQLIVRWHQGLPSSHAEVVTMAYSMCTFWIYILFWSKPQNVTAPRLISAKRDPQCDEIWMLAQLGPAYLLEPLNFHGYSIPENAVPRIATASFHPTVEGPESPSWQTMQRRVTLWAGGVIGGILVGLVHCIAWNFSFPTSVEKLLWRIASILTSALPIPWCILGVMDRYKPNKECDSKLVKLLYSFYDKSGFILSYTLVAVYIIVRLFLVVETFRALCFLPPEVFLTTWANFLPHVAS
jgi:hypothetical protein